LEKAHFHVSNCNKKKKLFIIIIFVVLLKKPEQHICPAAGGREAEQVVGRIYCLREDHADQRRLAEPMLRQAQLVFDGVGLEEGHAKANPIDNNGGQCNTGQETACRVNIPKFIF
jgi:hypothetical protein